MSSVKQLIKRRITSIEQIVKITQAMEVVSLFRFKKLEKKVPQKRAYFEVLQEIMKDITQHINYIPHRFFSLREAKKPLLLCIGSDKGLCGGFNLFVIQAAREFKKTNEAKIIAYGGRLAVLKKYFPQDVVAIHAFEGYSSEKITHFIFKEISQGTVDSVFLIANQFRANITGKTKCYPLIPLGEGEQKQEREYYFEGERLWDDFLFTYIQGALDALFWESKAAEEFMRIFAMKQAKDNAGDLKEEINLTFHKLRQRMITRELTDLCSLLM